ncbi:MAG: hypothetical protein F6J93_37745 [Oscillatoria sp. SIO1A7]|nr:hypothetical protein [Oscillatoria sp. SIO1A7]
MKNTRFFNNCFLAISKNNKKTAMNHLQALASHLKKVHPNWTSGEIYSAAIRKAATIDGFYAGYGACKGKTPDIEELKKALREAGLLKYAQIYNPKLYGTSELWETQTHTTKVIPIAQKRKIKQIKQTQRRLPGKQGIALFRPRRK